MDRRGFIVAAGGALAWPALGHAQRTARLRRIGLFLPNYGGPTNRVDFRPGVEKLVRDQLAAHGFVEGRNLHIASRTVSWNREADIRQARELAAAQPDGIFVIGSTTTEAVLAATRTVPVIFANVSDPVVEGLVKDYARPGGNATGVSDGMRATVVKRLELLREILPAAKRIVLSAPHSGYSADFRANETLARSTARQLGFELVDVDDWGAPLDTVLFGAAMKRPDAIFVYGPRAVVGFVRNPDEVRRFAEVERIPFAAANAEDAELGALFSYGTNFMDTVRRAVDYLARVLNGTHPSELPIDQASRFELVVNLKTAKALGIAVPQSILLRADRVIE